MILFVKFYCNCPKIQVVDFTDCFLVFCWCWHFLTEFIFFVQLVASSLVTHSFCLIWLVIVFLIFISLENFFRCAFFARFLFLTFMVLFLAFPESSSKDNSANSMDPSTSSNSQSFGPDDFSSSEAATVLHDPLNQEQQTSPRQVSFHFPSFCRFWQAFSFGSPFQVFSSPTNGRKQEKRLR